MLRAALIAIAVLLCTSAGATPVPIFAHTPYTTDARISDFGYTGGVNEQADGFLLSQARTIRGLVFWGAYNAVTSDDFTVRVFADLGTELLNPIGPKSAADYESQFSALTRVDTGDDFGGADIFRYSANLASPMPLANDTNYYLSIVNNTSNETYWSWALRDAADGDRWNRSPSTDWALQADADMAFEIYATQVVPVPVPTTLALFALGIAGVGMSRLRRKA